MSNCSVCGKVAEAAYSITHSECSHATHSDCLGDEIDYKTCPACLGEVETPLEDEPHTTDGVDYVRNPGNKEQPGMFSKVTSLVRGSKKPQAPVVTVETLLKKRVPIETIMKKHRLGLDHALKEGIMIDDYIINGYKLSDLKKYQYIGKEGPERALETLSMGLGLSANHLRDYKHLLPIKEFREVTALENSAFCTVLGLQFPEDGALSCFGDDKWNAKDCVALGLTIDDLIDFGLTYVQQYEDLMKGLARTDIPKTEKALGVTEKHIAGLIDLVALQEEEQEARRREIVAAREAKRVQEPIEEEYYSSSGESRSRSPSPIRERVTERRRVPVPKEKPIAHVPPSYRREMKKKYEAPPARKNPYSRHGFVDTK